MERRERTPSFHEEDEQPKDSNPIVIEEPEVANVEHEVEEVKSNEEQEHN